MELELAIALSARTWPDDLHRFLADHGGARVRLTAIRPEDLAVESFHALLIDDICSFLTPRLVDMVRRQGRHVIGVYDPEEPVGGKDRLLECGVSDVVDSSAQPEEILAVAGRVVGDAAVLTPAEAPPKPAVGREGEGRVIVVAGPAGGVGVSEVALGVAQRLSGSAVLVDADARAPSLAQRLGLRLHPNLLTAIDLVHHPGPGLAAAIQSLAGLEVIVGSPASAPRPSAVVDLVDELSASGRSVVVDAGTAPAREMDPLLLERADVVAAVTSASPVGIARLLDWLATAQAADISPAHVIVNRAPPDRFRKGEILDEIVRSYRPAGLAFLPEDDAVREAAWSSRPVTRGRFRKSLDRWVDRMRRRERR